ncbi:MAG: hypothetical protein ACLQM6_13155 [Acidobacteriaceae bacterium]
MDQHALLQKAAALHAHGRAVVAFGAYHSVRSRHEVLYLPGEISRNSCTVTPYRSSHDHAAIWFYFVEPRNPTLLLKVLEVKPLQPCVLPSTHIENSIGREKHLLI